MKIRGRRLLHVFLVLTVLLAVFARTAYAAPWDRNNETTTTTTTTTKQTTTSGEPRLDLTAQTKEGGEGASTGPTVTVTDENGNLVTTVTTRWDPPTDEFGSTLYPPLPSEETTTKKTTTTKKPTTRPFVVNPAHPEDKYNGALWYVKNPDLYQTTGETETTEPTTAIVTAWTMPEEQGYEPGGMEMRKIIGIAAAAILPIALIVAFAMIIKGRREAQREIEREAQRAARERTAAKREAKQASAETPPEPAMPLLNPQPPPVEAQEGKDAAKQKGETHADFLERFDKENPWFRESQEPKTRERMKKEDQPEDGDSK